MSGKVQKKPPPPPKKKEKIRKKKLVGIVFIEKDFFNAELALKISFLNRQH